MRTDPTIERLTRFALEADSEEFPLPEESIQSAVRCMIDYFAVTLAGSVEPSATLLELYAGSQQGNASIIGKRRRTSLEMAAFLNGSTGHLLDYDDVKENLGHGTVVIAPAVLALGESLGKSGRETLAAFVVGFEVAARLANSVEPAHSQQGWHTTSTCGVFGAAIACGKMLGLDQDSMASVFGIAASFSSGLRKNMGTPVKYLHAGQAAQNGLKAAMLGSYGFYGSREVLSGKRSFGETFSSPPDFEKITEGLGERFEVCANGFKLYPCCASAHTAIDAALSLRAKWRFRPEDIEEIRVGTVPIVIDNLGYQEPANITQARFSMPFCISLALTEGQVTLNSFSANRLESTEVKDLMKKVTLHLDPEMKSLGYRGTENSRVTIITENKQIVTERVDAARGHPFNPAAEEELRNKFLQCSKRALEEVNAVKLLATLEDFDRLPKLQHLFCLQDFFLTSKSNYNTPMDA